MTPSSEQQDIHDEFDLVVIGSGPAGQRAAVQAAKLGKKIGLVERMPSLGGVCILTGTVPSKTFREAVIDIEGAGAFHPGKKNPSKPAMSAVLQRVSEVLLSESEVVRRQLARNGVELIRGTGRFKDAHTLEARSLATVRQVRSKRFLIAVGTRPAAPQDVPVDGRIILTSDEILALEKLPDSMVVVGGGVIGIEYASFFARLGVAVTLIDRHGKPISFIDAQIVDELMAQMEAEGVTFLMNDGVATINVHHKPDPHAELTLNSGRKINCDKVLYSIGRIAATETLDLDRVGVEYDERGRLSVDEDYRTNVPHIYAAGDVIGFPALAATSSEQGRIATCRMFGIQAAKMGTHYPYGIYSIPEISMVGKTEEELRAEGTQFVTGVARYSEIARGQILGDETGLFKMLFHEETKELLGVHCIGTGATELVHVGQAALKLGGGLSYFLETVFNYPTLAECYKVAAFDAANKIGYLPESERFEKER